jgi:GGDEF domain-containing protein
MHLRVLLVEPNQEDALFLREVLADIEAERRWGAWIPVQAMHAAGWEDAIEFLASEAADVVLLSLGAGDADTFRRIQAASPNTPVVLLIVDQDIGLALHLLREGAQDFLPKAAADSVTLAHALRNAVERHRTLSAARASAAVDSLTGLMNRAWFFTQAERDRKLAERLNRRWMLLLAEPKNLAAIAESLGDERRDLTLVETADHLRSLMSPIDLLARIDESRFAIGVFDTGVVSIETAWARLHENAMRHRIVLGAAIFDPERPLGLEALFEQAFHDLAPTALQVAQA